MSREALGQLVCFKPQGTLQALQLLASLRPCGTGVISGRQAG